MKITFDVKDGRANVAVEDVDLTLAEVRGAGAEFLKGLLALGGQWLQASMAPPAPEDKGEKRPEDPRP